MPPEKIFNIRYNNYYIIIISNPLMLDLIIIYNYIYTQWNLYNPDTSGTSLKHVLIIEVSIGSFI